MNIAWAIVLSLFDIGGFIAAFYFYFQGDYAKGTFWLVYSISMELSAVRQWRRVMGKGIV